ncbi:MAG: hypothetical protein HY730_05785 [Candidatus Tectomicrobia bacterium]|uniref:FAD-binding domain-containing protein n=1 Tax=Tectimicrobiota bacterium TaxID=2528274 RepID=A0A933LQ87_UNCTE|nr:hypothetical protein [Candidatus Tectomicrobia bacterium]
MSKMPPTRIAVIGGGPGGSFFSLFALQWAEKLGLDISISIFDRKDFNQPGPKGCNMCAGAISFSLINRMKEIGVNLAPPVIQHEINGFCVHSSEDAAALRLLPEAKIYSVFRGGGPRRNDLGQLVSFDQFLLEKAISRGAEFLPLRVKKVQLAEAKVEIQTEEDLEPYYADLIIGAFGVNSTIINRFTPHYIPPKTWHTCQTEIPLSEDYLKNYFFDMIHIFPSERHDMKFLAVTPKRDYITVSGIGPHVKREDLRDAINKSKLRSYLPDKWEMACHCHPQVPVTRSYRPYGHRMAVIGDASYSRYLKNGIESAFITAGLAAETAFNHGITVNDWRENYDRLARKKYVIDNLFGKIIFKAYDVIVANRYLSKAQFKALSQESDEIRDASGKLSPIIGHMFSGDIPYMHILKQILDVNLQARLFFNLYGAIYGDLASTLQKSLFNRIPKL